MGERHDSSPTSRFEGWNELYSLDEFEELFNNYDKLSSKKYVRGFVFWTSARNRKKSSSSKAIQDQLRNLIEELAESTVTSSTYLLQIWVPKVVGGKRYLATSDQPFALGWRLSKGFSWYRKHCVDYKYFVGELGAKEEGIGPPGRVFRNEHPESSPDLLLYSNTEYPLRDYAVRCGATRYIALPLFDMHQKQCIGVLELLSDWAGPDSAYKLAFQSLEIALKKTGLGSIHNGLTWEYKNIIYQQNPLASEFTEMLEMATGTFPQLHLAQVWVPCQHCSYTDNNRSCMRRTAFRLASGNNGICGFSDACEFHNEQSNKGIAGIVSLSANKSCFCRNLCDFNISQYPLAHYAQGARLSFCFAICLQSLYSSADLCIFEFFFHPDRREDAYTWYILRTLFQIMEKKLVSFKVASGRRLGEEIAVEVGIRNNILASWELGFGQPNLSPCIQQKKHQNAREFTTIPTMAGYDKGFSLSDFLEYLQKPDLCCSLPSKDNSRYLFWTVGTKELQENGSNIRILLQDITTKSFRGQNFHGLVQFWALKEVKNRFYLSTSDQPFALTYLYKGLCWYRKQCMEHCYFVNEGVKEEELGPPGRVFQNGHPESSPDLRLYSTKEFPLRDNAARCGLRRYLALPIFDLHKEQCIGVLEYMGFSCVDWDNEFGLIAAALEARNLKSTHINFQPCAKNSDQELALTEIREMLGLVTQTPQLFLAQVWVPCSKCDAINDSLSCIERALSWTSSCKDLYDMLGCQSHKLQIWKGIAGIVLGSESKSCFYPNLCYFSIKEEPKAHYEKRARLDVCFAICLQSSYTGNNPYILEFFLDESSRTCEHLCSFLYFLLSVMKQKLKSFKVASGKQLGEELVVEVITFGENNEFASFRSSQPHVFPLRFEIMRYGREMKCQDWENQVAEATQNNITATDLDDLDEGVTVTTKISKRGNDEMNYCINCEDLEHHFGKKLKDVENELPDGRSKLKRACRECGIERSPSNAKNMKKLSILERSTANKRFRDCCTSESMQHVSKVPEVDSVIVRAKFNDDIVKIQLCLSSGMEKLTEEVARRLNLKLGSFKLKYVDEDGQLILLACDDDLQLCIKTLTSGRTPIQVLVQSICE